MTRAISQTGVSGRSRPIGVTILTALAAVSLVLAVVHLLQALGILPYFIGEIAIRDFNLWYVLLWAGMVWVWGSVVQALWTLDPMAWVFVLIVSGFNLMFDFFSMVTLATTGTVYTDLAISFIVTLVIFVYTLTPGTKRAFGVE